MSQLPLSDALPVAGDAITPLPRPDVFPVVGHDATAAAAPTEVRLSIDRLSAFFGEHQAVADVSLDVGAGQVTALIGPSGCGKSTVLRCINRMHELVPGAHAEGRVLFEGADVNAPESDPVAVRHAIGMVFQRPNPFPTKSIYDNVVMGLRFVVGRRARDDFDDVVERALTQAALWDEVKDRLREPATRLSGGQQQRLCIARAIAGEPGLLLMDEPCSALDPIATLRVEELIWSIKKTYPVLIVTHNMQQATRVSDVTAFMNIANAGEPGRLVECGPTAVMFTAPTQRATEDYISGRFG